MPMCVFKVIALKYSHGQSKPPEANEKGTFTLITPFLVGGHGNPPLQ